MNFSLILNSRRRSLYLRNFLESVRKTTLLKDSIEVIIRYDDDDEQTDSIKDEDFGFQTQFIRGPRPDNLLQACNEIAKVANGKNLFACNDDIAILTPWWDAVATNKINQYLSDNKISDDIYYCRTLCNSADRNRNLGYCSFPIISKKATDVLGFFMYDAFKTLGGDSSIYRVYDQINRVIDLQEVSIDHILHRTVQAVISPDLVASEYRQKFFSNSLDPMTFDISKEVAILNQYIDENKQA